MTGPGVEILEASGRSRRSSRLLGAFLALLVVAGGAVYVVDRQVRRSEEEALAACRASAAVVVERAYLRPSRMWDFVRPALDGGASIMVRVSLYSRVSDAAAGQADLVVAAQERCARVEVLRHHQALRAERERCLRLLDQHVAFLRRVAVDGRALGEAWPRSVARC